MKREKKFPEVFYVTIRDCARCGDNHDNLMFQRFQYPPDDFDAWGMCPDTNEPILMTVLSGE